MKRSILFIVFLFFIIFANAAGYYYSPGEVLNNAELVDGDSVTVRGYMTFGFEDLNIWNSKVSRDQWTTKECISLSHYGGHPDWTKYDKKYVELKGILRKDATEKGKILRLGACNNTAIELNSSPPPKLLVTE